MTNNLTTNLILLFVGSTNYALQESPTIWRNDRFQVTRADTLEDMVKNCSGRPSQKKLQEKLDKVNGNKQMCRQICLEAIQDLWITVINVLGFKFTNDNQKQDVKQQSEIKKAIKEIEPEEKQYAFVHYLFNYVKTHTYQDTVSLTHQNVTEDLIECLLNVTFKHGFDHHSNPKSSDKSCIDRLYGIVYNKTKQNLLKSILPPDVTIGLEHQLVSKKKNWKHKKFVYFIHRKHNKGKDKSKANKYKLLEEVSTRTCIGLVIVVQCKTNNFC